MRVCPIFLILVIAIAPLTSTNAFGQTVEDAPVMFDEAKEHFSNGDYDTAVAIYDDILEIVPNNISTLKMKGIALSNTNQHEQSMKQFYKILQYKPRDILALAGMGIGMGYVGEYHESQKYFQRALEVEPENQVIQNYKDVVDGILTKYPYTPTEKPPALITKESTEIPQWVKPVAKWWAEGGIEDSEFVDAINHLINKRIMQVPIYDVQKETNEKIPSWVKNGASWWAEGKTNDADFVSSLQYMMENGIMTIEIQKTREEVEKENKEEMRNFEMYLRSISQNSLKETRYIEFPNPSADVIKKFLRDYVKWNFDQEASSASSNFPDPTFEIIDGTYVIFYKVFVNEQPSGLPLDHVSTLNESLAFWETQELSTNGEKAKIQFEYTNKKAEANIWVTWVVRDLGDGVLGHAHLGKGVVEVALGDYSCDGSFQLYDVSTVKQIMTHELGHSVGLQHVSDTESIMYPSMKPNYAYCLLG